MNYYSIALFLHVVGALGFFVALGLEWTGLWQIRRATTSEQIRAWMGISKSARSLGIASMLAILISGFYMMATAWGSVAWIIVALGALVLLVVLTMALTGPRMAAIGGGSDHGERACVSHPPKLGEPSTLMDLDPDPSGHRPGHRLSHDRQARFRRVAAHYRRSDRARPCLSPT